MSNDNVTIESTQFQTHATTEVEYFQESLLRVPKVWQTSYTHLQTQRAPQETSSHIHETENVIFRLPREGGDHKLQVHQQDFNIILFESSSISTCIHDMKNVHMVQRTTKRKINTAITLKKMQAFFIKNNECKHMKLNRQSTTKTKSLLQ